MEPFGYQTIKFNYEEKYNDIKKYIKDFIYKLLPNEDANFFVIDSSMLIFVQAFTHSSFDNEYNYERLEKIGDAYLSSAFYKMIFDYFPEIYTEEDLSGTGQKYLDKEFLAKLSDEYGLSNLIIKDTTIKFNDIEIKSMKEDVFEAFICALSTIGDRIIDCYGYKIIYEIVKIIFKDKIDINVVLGGGYKKYISRLKELANKQQKQIEYKYEARGRDTIYVVYFGTPNNMAKAAELRGRDRKKLKEEVAKIAYNNIITRKEGLLFEISRYYNHPEIRKSIDFLSSKFNINLNRFFQENNFISDTELFMISKNNKKYDKTYGDISSDIKRAEHRAKDIFEIVKSTKKDFTNSVYLDIGSNIGENTFFIGKELNIKKRDVFGLDKKEFMGKKIEPKYDINMKFYENNKFPFDDKNINISTILQVLHHVEDKETFMSELSRIMIKNGLVILREHMSDIEGFKFVIDLEHLLYSSYEVDYDTFLSTFYSEYFSPSNLISLFSKFGFVNIPITKKFSEPSEPSGATRYYYIAFEKV